MHTDEYEIALSREVDVCRSKVRKYADLLAAMEVRHNMTTPAFQERMRLNELPPNADHKGWQEGIEALQRWSEKRSEYERLLNVMKISAS